MGQSGASEGQQSSKETPHCDSWTDEFSVAEQRASTSNILAGVYR